MSLRPLKTKVLLFPLPQIMQSPGGIHYPDSIRMGDHIDQSRFWVASVGPGVKEDLKVGDHVICPMGAEDHVRMEGGARVVEVDQIIARLETGTSPSSDPQK